MIADVLQEEKNKLSKLFLDVSNTIENLQFMNIADYQPSIELKNRWRIKLRKFLANIDNYQKNEFPVVVLGRWNSGKSTLINAILGEDVLPSANRELTSILTKVSYGNSKGVMVRFEGGGYQTIQISELEDYINFRGKKYSEGLEQIEISSDNSFLKGGLCILDTPGISSVNQLNNSITFDVIPKANSIILTFSGLDVGGEDNLNLIEQVLRLNFDNLYNVVFVITKNDLLSEEEAKEAKESLKELISNAQNRLGLVLKNRIQICMVSSYMELKYQQYLKHEISEEQLLKDQKLKLSSIEELELIHYESKFEEFYKILDESILNSENKKNLAYRLFIMIQNTLTELLEDYYNTYKYLSQSNSSSLKQISASLQHRVKIQEKIVDEGKKEIENFCEKIQDLKYGRSNHRVNKVINDLFSELCKYIDNTPYEVISKDKFEQLNKKINILSHSIVTDWMRDIKKEFDEELKKTLIKIAKIIEKNSKEFDDTFLQESQEININIYGIYMKTNLALSSFMISFASSASVGAGLFTIGNGILPGIGGIIGGIAGGLIGFVASMLNLSSSDKRKEILKRRLNKYLFERDYKYYTALKELFLQYENIVKLLEQYLDESMKQVTQEKDIFLLSYIDTKNNFKKVEKKLTIDIQVVKELIPEINLAFSQYIKSSEH